MILHGWACDARNCTPDDCTCGADHWRKYAKTEVEWNAGVLKAGHAPAWAWKFHNVPFDVSASCGACCKPLASCVCVEPPRPS